MPKTAAATEPVVIEISAASFDSIKAELNALPGGAALLAKLRAGMGPGEIVARRARGLVYVKSELIEMGFGEDDEINGGDCVDAVGRVFEEIKDL